MRHRRFARYVVAAPPPEPPPLTGQATFPLGINFEEWTYYYRTPIHRDLMRCGVGWNAPGASTWVQIDSQGWPTADFRCSPQWLEDTGVVDEIQVQFTGRLLNGSADMTIGNNDSSAYALKAGSWTYNAETNTTNFTLTVAGTGRGNSSYAFANTRRTQASTTSDGLTNIKFARPGYTIGDLAVSKYTDEIKALLTPFNCLRMVFPMRAWSNTRIVTWSQVPTLETTRTSSCYKSATTLSGPIPSLEIDGSYGYPLDELVELCNETNCSIYAHFYFNADDNCAANIANLIHSNLAAHLKCYLEWSNELWMPGQEVRSQLYDRVADECDGLWGDNEYETRAYGMQMNGTRTSNVLTVTSLFPHRFTNGQTVYTSNLASGVADGANTCTVISPTQFSVPSTGANGSVRITGTVISDLTTSLRLGSTLVSDDVVQVYALANRLKMRRTKEFSDIVRSVVGDANMGTRFRIVLADQMYGNAGGEAWAYMAAKWTARPVSEYIYCHAGAPYTQPQPYWTTTGATVDSLVSAWQTNLGNTQRDYAYERRAQQDRKYGVKSISYEHALDAVWTGGTDVDKQRRIDASFDTRLTANIKNDLQNFFKSGAEMVTWFNCKLSLVGANDAWGSFATWRSLTDTTSSKIAAINSLIADGTPTQGRHVSPVTIDGRAYGDSYPPYTGDFPNVSNSAIDYNADTREAQRTYSLRSTAASHDITITYSCVYADSFAIYVNNVKAGANVTGTPTGDHTTTATAVRTVTLVAGMNDIKVVAVAAQGDSYRFHSIAVT